MTNERHLGGCPEPNCCSSNYSSKLRGFAQIFLISGSPAALSAHELGLLYQLFPLSKIRLQKIQVV